MERSIIPQTCKLCSSVAMPLELKELSSLQEACLKPEQLWNWPGQMVKFNILCRVGSFTRMCMHLIGTLENRVLLGTSLCCQCNNMSVGKVYFASSAERLFCTVGVHPTRCTEFESYSDGPEAYLAALQSLAVEGSAERKVVAVGECGLDYDRCSLLWLFL